MPAPAHDLRPAAGVGALPHDAATATATPTPAERGSAMLIAIGALLVMSILAGVAVQAAVAGSDGSNTDWREKQAVQAAEAGLRTATYRLSMLLPAPTKCVVVGVADPEPETGLCIAPVPEQLGNGSSFTYRTTPALTSSSTCAGLPIRTQNALTQRCITSTGTTDGVTRRLQVRVAAYASTPLFPVPGILGLESVDLSGNYDLSGTTVATNGVLRGNGNGSGDKIGAATLGPRGTLVVKSPETIPTSKRTEAEGDFVLGPVDPGTSATKNDNVRIERGLAAKPTGDYDSFSKSSNATYDRDTRSLQASGNTTLNLNGKIYNFCSLRITGNLTLVISPGAKTSIYIDSPDNPNSRCPAGSGDVSIGGNFDSGSDATDATDLQLYVVGTADGKGSVTVNGNSTLTASIYAPRSAFLVTGRSAGKGAIAAKSVTMKGNAFRYDDHSGSLQTGSIGTYYRTAWRECPSKAPTSSPGAC